MRPLPMGSSKCICCPTKDGVLDSIREVIELIDTTSYEAEEDYKQAKQLVYELNKAIEAIEGIKEWME